MSIDHDKLVLESEADMLEAFQSFHQNVDSYVNVIHILEISPENSENVNRYITGLKCLLRAFDELVQVTEIIASLKGVEINS